jgi:hypothetical protein
MRTVYLVGAPGSGKSTALAGALARWGVEPTGVERPVPHLDYGAGRLQLGRARPGGFAGTDALAMNIQPRAVEWVRSSPATLLLAEGDRLANRGFLDACAEVGPVDLVWLDVSPAVARRRALERAERLGVKPQTEAWWRGRVTKVNRLVGGYRHLRIDGDGPLAQVVDQLFDIVEKE